MCSVAFSFLSHHLQYILFSNHCIEISIGNYVTELSIKLPKELPKNVPKALSIELAKEIPIALPIKYRSQR